MGNVFKYTQLIKQEALKVSNNCVTKFHLDEEDEKTEDLQLYN